MSVNDQPTPESADDAFEFDDEHARLVAEAGVIAADAVSAERVDIPDDARLWHYTSLDAASRIIEGGAMWATDADYLNDTTELRASAPYFDHVIRERRMNAPSPWLQIAERTCHSVFAQAMRTTCVLSFTTLEDDLSQWRSYGDDGRGCALAFEPSVLREASSPDEGSSGSWRLVVTPRTLI